MKIATFNINNVRKRLPNLLAWLRQAKPDVVCLQELKCTDAEFPAAAIRGAGYEAVWKGQKSWNGVAILGRGAAPIVTRTELPGDPADAQSRYIEAAVGGVLVTSFYRPNGNPQPGPKFDYKLAWMKRFTRHAATLYKANISDQVLRRRRAAAAREPQGLRAASRAGLAQRRSRALHPDAPMYTFYMRKRWERDAGL